MKNIFLLFILVVSLLASCNSTQKAVKTSTNTVSTTKTKLPLYWQQHVNYDMDIDIDVSTGRYKGKQNLVYANNSPDVLHKVYYHLFFNAFQPGSEMDIRLQNIEDPDGRMITNIGTKDEPIIKSRISRLKPNEIGFIKVNKLTQNGIIVSHETAGTVLEVTLNKPILPGEKVTFNMDFDAQIPLQIRRSGRDNAEGVALSMTQWYPKLAEYDFEGWHADPYIGREFHGVWGDFNVTLHINKNYVVGGTGYQQGEAIIKGNKKTLTYNAPNVHDFTWAADPNFKHDTIQVPNGPLIHFYYKKNLETTYLENWKNLQPKTVELMQYFSDKIGKYPYKQYSVIQGGDGGMEYAMCTLITGERKFGSLVGVTAHELAHSWFQFLLASNESKHEWMDEGFTSYISHNAMNEIMKQGKSNPNSGGYNGYYYLVKTGKEQPQTTHSDRYHSNLAYGITAYNKGEVFLAQLAYVIGEKNLEKTLKKYFTDFSFKHPRPIDIIRSAEKISELELDWYLADWTQTTNTIDYAVASIDGNTINLERKGLMPMPLDLTVTYVDGTIEDFYIPLQMMRGEKPTKATIIKDWAWAYPTYSFKTKKIVKSVQIDPKELMADVDKRNNSK